MNVRLFFTCIFLLISGGVIRLSAQTYVSADAAYRMVANYGSRAGIVKRDGQQQPNTRTVWFDLQLLRDMIDQIDADGGDGIRFYFAAYDDSYADTPQAHHIPPREYWGYNTLLLVPTRDSIAGGHVYHRDYFSSMDSTIVNRGLLCPPDCSDRPALLNP